MWYRNAENIIIFQVNEKSKLEYKKRQEVWKIPPKLKQEFVNLLKTYSVKEISSKPETREE